MSSPDRPLPLPQTLHYGPSAYPCPICRHGQLLTLTLMEAMGCGFCRHIFTIQGQSQRLQVMDSTQPLTWVWMGQQWRVVGAAIEPINPALWALAIVLVLFPSGLVASGAYFFPVLPDAPLAWFPWAWVGLTLLSHGGLFLFGFLEYYQVPRYVQCKLWWQQVSRSWS
ncbi:hypothetical protein [Prochlorothrix hollandica]|uniref:Uncharacterized protein n=1 Tax=Prochlorothrix hollandica PCC 9006 = CALU 1027 TaxID=317619 RepID=A0A0M2PVC2_PROHO|nr:hypothetical protein [Prochlorothrix hollandica]KKI99057.1 hypothetical protein PROH_14765 [Prochlorothrix hollandica PCC 9006 = CALU 1027]